MKTPRDQSFSRRDVLRTSSALALAGAVPISSGGAAENASQGRFAGALCLFSKPVPQLNWQELARSAKEAGFGGIDLTVRRAGHVLPERVSEDLPKAVEAIRAEGLEVPMITTELLSASDPTAKPILKTAAQLSIPYFKFGYYHYRFIDVRKELDAAGQEFRGLAELGGHYGIQGGYHNHERYIGSPIWDMATVMDTLDARWVGYYFDLRHATADGGVACWKIAANLVMPRLKMLAVKDFFWSKTKRGWDDTSCPLGDGMCHWAEFFQMVAASSFRGPISLHLEYATPGVTDSQGIALSRSQTPAVMAIAKRDLTVLKAGLRQAYGEA